MQLRQNELKEHFAKFGADFWAPAKTPDFSIEKELFNRGFKFIAGFDEAGRGALAGPLAVGCVLYGPEFISSPVPDVFSLVNDSKKLSLKQRLAALEFIAKYALYFTVELIPRKIIDKLNINGATELALRRLLANMPQKPDIAIVDGSFSFNVDAICLPVKRGDGISISIASASVAAKVGRDKIMEKMSVFYPGYGFEIHKGYGTSAHIEALNTLGPSPIHRKSYQPVKKMLQLCDA